MDDLYFMCEALKEAEKALAEGEVPIGAVVIDKDGNIIARGHNMCERTHDAAAHAEIVAIKAAGEYLHNWRLTDCTLYVTMEPCPMCCGAMINARIKRVVYGANEYRYGAAGTLLNLLQFPAFEHNVLITGPIMPEECAKIVSDFFQERRK